MHYYMRFYPHESSMSLKYDDVEFDLAKVLARESFIGREVGESKNQNQNILVPMLHLVVLENAKVKFKKTPLIFDHQYRVLSKKDGMFNGDFSEMAVKYAKMASEVLERSEVANINIKDHQRLNHSERVMIGVLSNAEYVKSIVSNLTIKNGSKVLLSFISTYSTNSCCSKCTAALIGLQNSYEEGGFMNILQNELSEFIDDDQKLRLDIFVTSDKNYTPQAHSLAIEHNAKTGRGQKNAHARIFMGDDAIQLNRHGAQRNFIYEFVGADFSEYHNRNKPFEGKCFMSGSNANWRKKVSNETLVNNEIK